MRNYISVHLQLSNLITEIRNPSLFIGGFVPCELNQISNEILFLYCNYQYVTSVDGCQANTVGDSVPRHGVHF